nr:MATE family efflux transporter [uncultured Cohaesibacter sp.]
MTDKTTQPDEQSSDGTDTAQSKQQETGKEESGKKEVGKFVTGPIFRHVVTMTSAGSVGLLAVFAVDFANLFYISLLGHTELAAAIGYSATLMFFNTSVGIGLAISGSAIVARALGAGDKDLAGRRAGSALVTVGAVMSVIAASVFSFIPHLLTLLGATGEAHLVAVDFLSIVIPSLPLLGVAMMLGGILRANGDAKGSMIVTLSGGVASAILDPIFIFGLNMGVTGAAVASVLSRMVMIAAGVHRTFFMHRLVLLPKNISELVSHWRVLFPIAIPAIATNVATPVGNAYVTMAIARHGDAAVAGWAIVGRIIPIAYTALFALSGSVGPIFSQNLGAERFDRVRATLKASMTFILIYSVCIWLLLFSAQNLIVTWFNAQGDTENFVRFFCNWVAASGIFMGFLFVSNAAFNNLGYPTYSTFYNWGKATIGTIPPVMLGTYLAGAEGAILGQAVGTLVFGTLAIVTCFRVIHRREEQAPQAGAEAAADAAIWRRALSGLSSGKANM